MSKYVMSDLHGCYNEFIKMLKLIDFKDTDELYILGDIFDRGKEPLKILDYIISHKNIILLKGNHEKMYEECFENGDASLWYYNGGEITHSQLIQRDYLHEEAIYKYIKGLPYIKVIDKFILVHAGAYFPNNCNELTIEEFINLQEEDTCLWDRSNVGSVDNTFKDYTVICGHTPVQSITNNCDDVKIIHNGSAIYIDCGCVFKKANGKLACLCLTNMEEYYV